MSLPRVYYSSKQNLICDALIVLPTFQVVRISLALRMRKGDELIIFNERDGSFLAVIQKLQNECIVQIRKFLKSPEILKTLIVGVPCIKNHRFNFILEAITQLGATSIIPMKFDRSNFVSIKPDKILKQVIGAVEQCGRHSIPLIESPLNLSEFVSSYEFIVCANEKSHTSFMCFSDSICRSENIAVLVGPEGGFSESEQQILTSAANVKNVTLGSLILRSETAVSSVLSQIRLLY